MSGAGTGTPATTTAYATVAELKTDLGISDSDDDTLLSAVLDAVSRFIDDYCGRRFYTTSSDETRYYTALHSDWLIPDDDIISVTTLATDADGDRTYEDTWAATDFDLEPFNAALDSRPYYKISVTPDGDYSFPHGVAKGVSITGKFGYFTSVPTPVKKATLIQAARIYKRKDAPFGVTGSAEFGTATIISRLDPDVRFLLAPYRRLTAV